MRERNLNRLFLLSCWFVLFGCGGGGGVDLGPIWVPTDVAVTDIDGDGRNDVVTIAKLSKSHSDQDGYIVVYRQTGPGAFASPETYPVGSYPWRLEVADIDGDGLPDLVVTDVGRPAVWLLLQGSEPGTFSGPTDTSLAGVSGILDAAVADLNGNGRPDFAVVGFFPVGSPSSVESRFNLFTRSGGGAFSLTDIYDLPVAASRVAAGDIDGDGLNDLAVPGDEHQTIVLIQSQAQPGTFNAPQSLP